MLKGRRGKRRGGGSRRDLLRTDADIFCVNKNPGFVIAKAMFRDGHLSGESQRIGAALIAHFRIKSGEEGFGEFGEVHIGALNRAPPKNKVRDRRERNQNERQDGRVPKSEPDADGVKHGSSGLETWPWHDDVTRCFRRLVLRLPNQSEGRRSSRRRGGYETTVFWKTRSFCGSRKSTKPTST